MTRLQCSLIAFILPLVGCSSPVAHLPSRPTGTTVVELSSLYERPALKFSKARVACVIDKAGEKQTFPALMLRPTGRAKTVSGPVRELIYPTEFDFAEVPEATQGATLQGVFPITPAHPKKFTNFEQGWTLTLSAEPQASFVMLRGTLTNKRMGRFVRAVGKPYQEVVAGGKTALGRPAIIVVSENRAEQPSLVREEIPILIAADPGSTYRIQLDEAGTEFAEFRCDIE